MQEPKDIANNADTLELFNRAVDAKITIQEGNSRIRQLRKLYGMES